jgi:hypothetical protein
MLCALLLQVLGQQPYSSENQLEACGGAGPSQASKSAAAAMAGDLGPNTRSFAVNTLGKMHGMGGNKAWVSAAASFLAMTCSDSSR